MIKKIFKTVAVLSLVAFAGQASADTINARWGSAAGDASADFSWEVKADGELVIQIANTSRYAGAVTSLRFNLGGGASIDGLVEVRGTGADDNWGYGTDSFGCWSLDCLISGSSFYGGNPGDGVAAGSTATFRFAGDFTGLTQINGVTVRFRGTGESGWGRGAGYGCHYGCDPSEVPEPGTLLMFAAGLLGFGFVARRRRII